MGLEELRGSESEAGRGNPARSATFAIGKSASIMASVAGSSPSNRMGDASHKSASPGASGASVTAWTALSLRIEADNVAGPWALRAPGAHATASEFLTASSISSCGTSHPQLAHDSAIRAAKYALGR